MKIKIGELNVRVLWKHDRLKEYDGLDENGNPAWITKSHGGTTLCFIKDEDSGALLATGSAVCTLLDVYNKAVGRKISFTRALSLLDVSKEQRTIIWEEYFDTVTIFSL